MSKEQDEVFSTIQWTKTDIENLLKENDCDCSEQSVDEFVANFDIRHFEEQCIQLGWELLQSEIR